MLLGCKELGIQAEPPPTTTGPSHRGADGRPHAEALAGRPRRPAPRREITNPKQAPIGPAPTGRSSPLPHPVIYQVAAATPPVTGSAPPITVNGGEKVMLNFVGADVHEVVSSILGDTLKINYSIDPKVTGTVTFRTMSPIPKSDLLGLLEDMLALSGAAMVPHERRLRHHPARPGGQDAHDPAGQQRPDRLRSRLRHPYHPGAFRLARQPEIRRRAAAATGPPAVHRRPASPADVCRHEQRSLGRGRSHLHPRCRSHGRQILRPLPGQIFRSHGGGERAAHDPGPGRQRGGGQSHPGRGRRPDERHIW